MLQPLHVPDPITVWIDCPPLLALKLRGSVLPGFLLASALGKDRSEGDFLMRSLAPVLTALTLVLLLAVSVPSAVADVCSIGVPCSAPDSNIQVTFTGSDGA